MRPQNGKNPDGRAHRRSYPYRRIARSCVLSEARCIVHAAPMADIDQDLVDAVVGTMSSSLNSLEKGATMTTGSIAMLLMSKVNSATAAHPAPPGAGSS